MEEIGVSQGDMAAILGLTRGAVSHYVNGTREPSMQTLASLIRELGVTADWVVLGIQNKAKGPGYSSIGVSKDFAKLNSKEKSKINTAIEILALAHNRDGG